MKSITRNNRLNLIWFSCICIKNIKIDIAKIANEFIPGKNWRKKQFSLLQVS